MCIYALTTNGNMMEQHSFPLSAFQRIQFFRSKTPSLPLPMLMPYQQPLAMQIRGRKNERKESRARKVVSSMSCNLKVAQANPIGDMVCWFGA